MSQASAKQWAAVVVLVENRVRVQKENHVQEVGLLC